MNKKLIAVIVIILIAVGIIVGINISNEKKVDYEISEIKTYNYFKFLEKEKYGVINRNGEVLIEAKYDDIIIPNPEKDIFICYNGNTSKIYNSSKEELFTQYSNAQPIKLKNVVGIFCYEKNVLKYEKDGLFGLINFNGKELTKNLYSSIENLQLTEGKFLVKKDEKYGVINLNGVTLIDVNYDEIKTDGAYSETEKYNRAGFITAVKTDNGVRYGYVAFDGKKVLKEEYNDIVRIPNNEKVCLIVAKDGRYGVYENSKRILNNEYQSISYCENGALIIEKNKNYGIASLDGKILVEPKYASIESKGLYLYAQSSNEKKIYDANGNSINMNYSRVVYETENEKYRIVTLINNNKIYYGIEDNNGKELIAPSYEYIEYIFNDYFIAKNEKGNLGIIQANGNKLVNFDYETLQRIKGKNIVQAIKAKSNKTEIYSSELKVTVTMNDANINNEDGYILVYNDKEKFYMDENGNKLKNDSDVLKRALVKNFPEEVGKYKKVQKSLDELYYVKK